VDVWPGAVWRRGRAPGCGGRVRSGGGRHAVASSGCAAADGSLSPGARGPQRPLCSGGTRRPVRRRESAAWARVCVPRAGARLPVLRLSALEPWHWLHGGRGARWGKCPPVTRLRLAPSRLLCGVFGCVLGAKRVRRAGKVLACQGRHSRGARTCGARAEHCSVCAGVGGRRRRQPSAVLLAARLRRRSGQPIAAPAVAPWLPKDGKCA